ncbi:hypothetical protein VUR80DRAFT_5413 [Thermomyces stellatus]
MYLPTRQTGRLLAFNLISMSAVPSAQMGFLKSLSFRVYNLGVLSFYDVWVLWISCSYAWRAPVETTLLPFFRAHFSQNHLDIGVGTGFFPAAVLAEKQPDHHQLTLWDLSTTALRKAKARVEAVAPNVHVWTIEADATAFPAGIDTTQKYDSISASFLLHCIPMPTSQKIGGLVSTAQQLLSPTGVFYGATVLGNTARKATTPSGTIDWITDGEAPLGIRAQRESATGLNIFGRMLMWAYNLAGIFSNWGDEPDVIVEALEKGFRIIDSWIIGRVLFFRAQGPRPLGADASK